MKTSLIGNRESLRVEGGGSRPGQLLVSRAQPLSSLPTCWTAMTMDPSLCWSGYNFSVMENMPALESGGHGDRH